MRRLIYMRRLIAVLVAFSSCGAFAADPPDWAFPVMQMGLPPAPPDDGKPKQMPGSSLSFSLAQINDPSYPVDWYPEDHPPMPNVVAHGANGARACDTCHLPNGLGHPESANLAGLPKAYFERQIADFRGGTRKGNSNSMTNFSRALTQSDLEAAADYFSSLKPVPWVKVVETDTVPKSFVGKGNMRFIQPGGATEAIGDRIIEVPVDGERSEERDDHSGFIAYVPKGSVEKGKILATEGGNGKTVACVTCHGADLRGVGDIPRIAGRSAIYIVRQLWQIQTGGRSNAMSAMMKPAVGKLDLDDMLTLAAYVSSQTP